MILGGLTATQISTTVWSQATRTLTDYSRPTTSEGVGTAMVAVASGNNVKGAFVQLIAATAAASKGLIVQFQSAAAVVFSIDMAVGGVGAEVVVVADLKHDQATAVGQEVASVYFPFIIASGSRISCRAFAATVQTVNVSVTVLE